MGSIVNISIIIPAYNAAETIEETLDSIPIARPYERIEAIVVDDGSTDNTGKLARARGAKVLRHKSNRGVSAARNTAINIAAKYDWLYCLDADNVLDSDSFHMVINMASQHEWNIVAPAEIRSFENDDLSTAHALWEPWGRSYLTVDDLFKTHSHPVSSGNYLFTRSIWLQAGGYPEFTKTLDSWGFGLRALMAGALFGVCQNAFYFHRWYRESNWGREGAAEREIACEQLLVPYRDRIPLRYSHTPLGEVFHHIPGLSYAQVEELSA